MIAPSKTFPGNSSTLTLTGKPFLIRGTSISGTAICTRTVLKSASVTSAAFCAAPPEVAADFVLSGGRLDDPRLSRPVTELTGRIVADGSQLKIEQLHGKWDTAVVALSLNRSGWQAMAPIALSARIDDVLEIESHVVEAKGATLNLAQRISRAGTVLFEAEVLVVLVSVSGKPQRISQRIRAGLAAR